MFLNDKGIVLGEVYEVDKDTLYRLDQLESEGYLYKKVKEKVASANGKEIEAYVYVFLNPFGIEIKPYNKYVQSWQNDVEYVYYVCYGSNLLFQRFMLYMMLKIVIVFYVKKNTQQKLQRFLLKILNKRIMKY